MEAASNNGSRRSAVRFPVSRPVALTSHDPTSSSAPRWMVVSRSKTKGWVAVEGQGDSYPRRGIFIRGTLRMQFYRWEVVFGYVNKEISGLRKDEVKVARCILATRKRQFDRFKKSAMSIFFLCSRIFIYFRSLVLRPWDILAKLFFGYLYFFI